MLRQREKETKFVETTTWRNIINGKYEPPKGQTSYIVRKLFMLADQYHILTFYKYKQRGKNRNYRGLFATTSSWQISHTTAGLLIYLHDQK